MSKTHDKRATDYSFLFVADVGYDENVVYKIGDRFFVASHRHKEPFIIKEVKKVTKLVKVNTWEDVKNETE